jgi:NTP pyrophosphatase (non-canonical NTP hydrolase)
MVDSGRPAAEGICSCLTTLSRMIHQTCVDAGWWTDLATGEPKERNVGELLCLVHSEISEAMEGARKNLMDDHLPHRKMFEVELADALIRIFDMAGHFGMDLGAAVHEKWLYNMSRADHKIEARKAEGGKTF